MLEIVCNCVFGNFVNNKAVEGSGSEGAPKYDGGGCDIRGIFGDISHFSACARLLMRHISWHSQVLTSSRRNIVVWCRMKHC